VDAVLNRFLLYPILSQADREIEIQMNFYPNPNRPKFYDHNSSGAKLFNILNNYLQ